MVIEASTREAGEASTREAGEASRRITSRQLWGVGTHRGNVRGTNQDTIVVEPDLGLYAVLDGMGGAASGDVASRLAGERIANAVREHLATQQLSPRDLLESAINEAAAAVFDLAANDAVHQGMGTTVVACLFSHAHDVLIAHAGDSRAYLLRHGNLRQITRDHTLWQEYSEEGRRLSDRQGKLLRSILTRNLGEARGVAPDIVGETLEAGDRLLLCSDGLYDAVPHETMQQILSSAASPSAIALQLVNTGLNGPCSDNISALVIALTSLSSCDAPQGDKGCG